MFTYFLMGLPFVLVVVLLDMVMLRTRILLTRECWAVMGIMLLLTAIFNQLFTGLPIYEYNEQKILGIRLGFMPVEDFMYTMSAVIGAGSLRKKYGQGKS